MTLIRSSLIAAAVLASLAACGSDDDSDAAVSDETESTADAASTDASDSGSDAGSDTGSDTGDGDAGGAGVSTITFEGTTYELDDMGDCEGSNTDSSAFPFPDNFSLSGGDSDSGLRFNIARNGPEDELFVQVGALEGAFDENGKNNEITYVAQMDTLDFTVNGPDVSGSVTVRAIGPNRPYGDETVVDFDFDC